ncbi:hypothetical protein IJC60_03460 [bacterium]|nr:hypothetical protein [bacterium]
MKKLVLIFFILLSSFAHGATLSGGVSQNVDNGFMGSWLVSGELVGEPIKGFQVRTNQFWNLGKINNVMVLENRLTGARGVIKIDKAFTGEKSYLKFTNICKNGDPKTHQIVLKETPEIYLSGNKFEGIDTFEIKKYKNGTLYKEEVVKYKIIGKKIY